MKVDIDSKSITYHFNKKKISQPFENIKYLEGNGLYTKINFKDGASITVLPHLLVFEKLLKEHKFFIRVHRSYIINTFFIKNIDFEASFLRLISNEPIPIIKPIYEELENLQLYS